MNDSLGDRMKAQYEDRTRFSLPRRTYTIIRVDGKAFHTFTKNCERPFDKDLMNLMDETAIALCKEIQGACFAYTQSDEISILVTDFDKITTNAWFDGNIQKMASIAASTATAAFNRELRRLADRPFGPRDLARGKLVMFDARVFTIPEPVEVANYFVWRQQDATRNSIQMAARSVYSHKECENKGCSDLQEMIHQKGINWNSYTSGEKRGRCIVKQTYEVPVQIKTSSHCDMELATRTRWVSLDGECYTKETPIFTQDRNFLKQLIPAMPAFEAIVESV